MITLIVDSLIGGNRQVFENLTIREVSEKIVELCEKYIVVFDTVMNLHPAIGCDLYITIASERDKRYDF